MLASISRIISLCSASVFFRRSSILLLTAAPAASFALMIPNSRTGNDTSEQPVTGRSAGKPQPGIPVNIGSRSR
jgi:hypothetical protein